MAEGSAWLSNCETTWCLSVCSTLVMYSSQQFKAKCHLGRELCLFVRWDSQFHRESVGRRSLLLCRCEAGVIKMFCFQRYWATDSCESELIICRLEAQCCLFASSTFNWFQVNGNLKVRKLKPTRKCQTLHFLYWPLEAGFWNESILRW